MSFLSFFGKSRRNRLSRGTTATHRQPLSAEFSVEQLEQRIVPYVTTGNAWPHPELVTLSFIPDGTNTGGDISTMFQTWNARFGSTAAWQNQILKSAQVWAQQTNLNFTVVSDNGTYWGGYQQGDPNYGDIRFSGSDWGNSTLAGAVQPPPINNYDIAGDIDFNVGQAFNIGSTFDLATVAMHEVGHALGLGHSSTAAAVMFGLYNGTKTALNSDDINGIRAIYGGARSKDSYDNAASNGTFGTATNVTSLIDSTSKAALVNNLDITTTSDIDYYKFTAPSGGTGSLTVKVQSSGLSLLAPKVWVYNNGQTQLATATGTGYQGSTLTVTVNGIVAGQNYYVKVDGADATAFGTGRYAVTLNFGTGDNPAVPLPNTQTPNGDPISSGGSMALEEFHAHPRFLRSAGDDHVPGGHKSDHGGRRSDDDDSDRPARNDDRSDSSVSVTDDWDAILDAINLVLEA